MKDYIILKTKDYMYPYVCFVNLIDDVYYIESDIRKEMLKFSINNLLVDLFLINGYSYNRFFELNNSKDKKELVNPRIISPYVYEKINEYLKNNMDILNQSALSKRTINIVQKQLQ